MQDKLVQIMQRFGADTGTVHLLEGDVLVLKAHVGLPDHVASIVGRVPLGKGMAGLAAERNEPVDSCNIQTDTTGNVRPGAKATGVNAAICVPIRGADGAVRGALGIGVHREHAYSKAEADRLMALASDFVPS